MAGYRENTGQDPLFQSSIPLPVSICLYQVALPDLGHNCGSSPLRGCSYGKYFHFLGFIVSRLLAGTMKPKSPAPPLARNQNEPNSSTSIRWPGSERSYFLFFFFKNCFSFQIKLRARAGQPPLVEMTLRSIDDCEWHFELGQELDETMKYLNQLVEQVALEYYPYHNF